MVRVLKVVGLGLAVCFLISASRDLVRANPYLCRDNRDHKVCPELGKPLSVRWNDLQVAIDALSRREKTDTREKADAEVTPARYVVKPELSRDDEFTVMVYNVKGLPAALRGNASPDAFRVIGERLAARRRAGTAPDVVLLQEVFTDEARKVAAISGYKTVIHGPGRENTRTNWFSRPFVYLWKAAWDRSVHLEGSGLMILTDLPVDAVKQVPFGHRACAGTDCFANKGLAYVRVRLPHSDQWVDIVDTHLNSNDSSGAGIKQILSAHEEQVDKIHDLIDAQQGTHDALIVGGDFNSNPETVRYAYLQDRLGLADANTVCLVHRESCDIPSSVNLQAFWRGNKLREFYRQGASTHLEPVRATMDFTRPYHGKPLSDHDAIEITYRVGTLMASN